VSCFFQTFFLYRFYPYDSLFIIFTLFAVFLLVCKLPMLKSLLFTLLLLCYLEAAELLGIATIRELFNLVIGEEVQMRGAASPAMKAMYVAVGSYLCIFILSWHLGNKYYLRLSERKKILLRICAMTAILIGYYILFIYLLSNIQFRPDNEFTTYFQAFLYISFIINTIFLGYTIYSNIRLYQSAGENRTLRQQMDAVQTLTEELRLFKHNYLNILYSFGPHIAESDSPELIAHYEQTVQESRRIGSDNIISIQKIRNASVHNLLMSHMAMLKKESLPFFLGVSGDLGHTRMKDVDLCQVLGIFLDNAREAAAITEEPQVKLDILVGERLVEFYIYNSFSKSGQGGAPGKSGADRGCGLIYADDILGKYKNIIHNAYESNGQFVQQLIVEKQAAIF